MKANYRPDGWLGILVSGKIYVDFTKVDFDTAYQRLINEINRHRTTETQIDTTQKPIQHQIPTLNRVVQNNLNVQQTIIK